VAYRDDFDELSQRRERDADQARLLAAFFRGERVRRRRVLAISLGILVATAAIVAVHARQPAPRLAVHRESPMASLRSRHDAWAEAARTQIARSAAEERLECLLALDSRRLRQMECWDCVTNSILADPCAPLAIDRDAAP
jgi:hypothetical protein